MSDGTRFELRLPAVRRQEFDTLASEVGLSLGGPGAAWHPLDA
jgi:hypothetical protein